MAETGQPVLTKVKRKYMNATILTRIQEDLNKAEATAARIKQFIQSRTATLEAAMPKIAAFTAKHKCLDTVEYSNAYSTGWDGTEYAADAQMVVTCTTYFTQGIKDAVAFKRKFLKDWDAAAIGVSINEMRFRIMGGTLEFEIRVK